MRASPGWGAAALTALLVAGGLLAVGSTTTLWDRDEPRFAQATVEMLRSGNFLYPTFNGELRPDKPILIYWLMSLPVRLFGVHAVAFRCVAALGLAVTALAIYAVGRWLFNPATGLLAAGILVTTPLALVEASVATADAWLLACITVTLAAFAHAFRYGWRSTHGAVMALGVGTALLTKGPVGLLLPVASVALAWWLGRKHSALKTRHLGWMALAAVAGLGLFLAWAVPANVATAGELARRGLGYHVLRRAVAPIEGHGGPWVLFLPYYLAVIPVAFFPWTLYLGGAVAALIGGRGIGVRARALLVGWIAPTVVLMTLIPTKLPHYVFPVWPALALATAATIRAAASGELDDRERRWLRRGEWLGGVVALLLATGCGLLPRLLPAPGLAAPAIATAVLLIAIPAVTVVTSRVGRAAWGVVVLLAGMIVVDLLLAAAVLPALDRLKLSPRLATVIRARTGADVPVATRGYSEPSLVFALADRRVGALASDEEIGHWARAPAAGVLVVPRATWAAVAAQHGSLGLQEIGEVRGFNFGRGEWLELVVLVRDGGGPLAQRSARRLCAVPERRPPNQDAP